MQLYSRKRCVWGGIRFLRVVLFLFCLRPNLISFYLRNSVSMVCRDLVYMPSM